MNRRTDRDRAPDPGPGPQGRRPAAERRTARSHRRRVAGPFAARHHSAAETLPSAVEAQAGRAVWGLYTRPVARHPSPI
jgi:hypothetical protein